MGAGLGLGLWLGAVGGPPCARREKVESKNRGMLSINFVTVSYTAATPGAFVVPSPFRNRRLYSWIVRMVPGRSHGKR